MGFLNTDLLADKLKKLSSTQQSIESLSQWCIFYKSDLKKIVEVWHNEFQQVSPDKRIAFLYLANDLLQKARKSCPDLPGLFFPVLSKAFKLMIKSASAKDIDRVKRMVTVWGERNVYSGNAVKQLLEQLPAIAPAQPASEPPEKKQRIEDEATRPLLEAMFEASRLEILSNKSLVALSQPCRPNLEKDGTMEELKAAEKPLVNYIGTLLKEIAARQKAETELKTWLDHHEKSRASSEQKLQLSRQHLQKVKSRMEAIQPDTPMPSTQADNPSVQFLAPAMVPRTEPVSNGSEEAPRR